MGGGTRGGGGGGGEDTTSKIGTDTFYNVFGHGLRAKFVTNGKFVLYTIVRGRTLGVFRSTSRHRVHRGGGCFCGTLSGTLVVYSYTTTPLVGLVRGRGKGVGRGRGHGRGTRGKSRRASRVRGLVTRFV